MSELCGQQHSLPALRFNRANPSANHPDPRRGLRNWGPYDLGVFGKDKLIFGLLYPAGREDLRTVLTGAFIDGAHPFQGFQSLFKVPLEFGYVQPYANLSQTLQAASARELDLVVVILDRSGPQEPYRLVKQWLSGNGIPSQIVTVPNLADPGRLPWVVENMSVACYGKTGGAPWVVQSESSANEIIIGVSSARDQAQDIVVGFVTLFNGNGDFLYMGSQAPVLHWPKRRDPQAESSYVAGMKDLIEEAFQYYQTEFDRPDSVVLHLCKRPGPLEIAAAREAAAGWNIPFAILHVNDDTTFRLFDTTHPTYVPKTGLTVSLGQGHSLVLLDGRTNGERRRRGVPRLVEVRMDPRSTIPADDFPRLEKQVLNLARMNWRGFNAKASPASLNYSYLIASLVVTIGLDRWNALISQGRLRDKAWFL